MNILQHIDTTFHISHYGMFRRLSVQHHSAAHGVAFPYAVITKHKIASLYMSRVQRRKTPIYKRIFVTMWTEIYTTVVLNLCQTAAR
jgi:hypothetical protein